EQLYGWRADEVLGRNITNVTVNEVTREQATKIMAALAQGDRWTGEFQVQRRDGSTFPALIANAPVRDPQDNLVAVVGVSFDITERQRTDQALQAALGRAQELYETSRRIGMARTAQEVLEVLLSTSYLSA